MKSLADLSILSVFGIILLRKLELDLLLVHAIDRRSNERADRRPDVPFDRKKEIFTKDGW